MDPSYNPPAYVLLLPPLFTEDPRRDVKWSPESWWTDEVLKALKHPNLTIPAFKIWREIVTNKLNEWALKCQWIETNVKDFSKNHFRIESEQIIYFLQHGIAGKLSRFRPSLKGEGGCYISPCFDERRKAIVEACYGLAGQVERECERQNVMVEPSVRFSENLGMLSVAIGRLSLEGLNVECPDEFAIDVTRKGLRKGRWRYPRDRYLANVWYKLKPVGTGCGCIQCKIQERGEW